MINWLLLLLLPPFLLVANQKLAYADTVIDFPNQSVGSLYCASPNEVHFGAEAHLAGRVPHWEFIAPAAGQVRLPKEKLIRLSLNISSKDIGLGHKPNWVNRIPNHAIHSLHVVNTPFNDETFAEFANWTALQELKLMGCDVTSNIDSTLSRLTHLKSLYLSRLPLIDDTLLATVAELPDLREVHLRRMNLTDSGMAMLSRSDSLTFVLVDGVSITDDGIAALVKLHKLLALNVYAEESDDERNSSAGFHTKVTDLGLEHIGTCPQLESLNIHGANVSLAGLQRLFGRCLNLRYLALSRSAVDLGALRVASSLEHLETIRITGTVLSDEHTRQLSQLKNLRKIESNLRISNVGVEQLASLQHLESLQFSGEADNKCMSDVAKLHNLKELSIALTRITDDGLERLKGSTRLERVHLNGPGFSSKCLQTIATWPNLHTLSLQYLDSRQDGKADWSEMPMLPSKVRSLELLFCPEIGDDHLRVIGSLPHLESLSIHTHSIKSITDTGARYLGLASKLKSLAIRPSCITDQGLSSLQAIETLESLDITCVATSVGLTSLGNHKRLRSLAINSPDLSPTDAEDFLLRYPHIQQFRIDESHISRDRNHGKQDSILRQGSVNDRVKLNALEGKAPPAIHATSWTPTDGYVTLDQLRGKVVLVDFWGTWCGACLKEFPRIHELHEKYKQKGLVVITIHSSEGADNMVPFLRMNPVPWLNGCDVNNQAATDFAVDTWPSIYLIDKQGTLRFANPLRDHLEEAIDLLIEE